MRRHLLGLIAIVFIVAGLLGTFSVDDSDSASGMKDAAGVGLRAGLVLGAFWIAYPQLVQLAKRFPKWLYAVLGVIACVVAFGPRSLIIVVPALLILAGLQLGAWFLKPLPKQKRTANSPPAKKQKEERV